MLKCWQGFVVLMNYLCCSTVPEYMPPPHVSPVSSSSLRVSWEMPQDKDVRGEVTEYRVNLQQEQMSNPYAPPIVTQVSISAHSTFFLDRKGPLPEYSDVLAHSFEASVAILSCTLLHPSHRTLPIAPVFQFFSPSFIDMCCCSDKVSCRFPLK